MRNKQEAKSKSGIINQTHINNFGIDYEQHIKIIKEKTKLEYELQECYDSIENIKNEQVIITNEIMVLFDDNYPDKNIIDNLHHSAQKIASFLNFPYANESIIDEIDNITLEFLECIFYEKQISGELINKLLKIIQKHQTNEVFTFVSKRWEVNKLIIDNKNNEAKIKFDEIQNQHSNSKIIPRWLFTDLLIDKRNLINKIEKNIFNPTQTEINKLHNVFHYPLIDKFKNKTDEYFFVKKIKSKTKPLKSFEISNTLINVFEALANHLLIALFFGSYTQIFIGFYEHLHKVANQLLEIEDNELLFLQSIKILIFKNDSYNFNKNIKLYQNYLPKINSSEADQLYDLINLKVIDKNQEFWKLKISENFGYYFSDKKFKIIEDEIFILIKKWIDNSFYQDINYKTLLINSIVNLRFRFSDEKKLLLILYILDKKPEFSHREIFKIIENLDFSIISKIEIRKLMTKMQYLFSNDSINIQNSGIEFVLLNIRKSNILSAKENNNIDNLIKENFIRFYYRFYAFEIELAVIDDLINYQIKSQKHQLNNQGKDNKYKIYIEYPIENIITFLHCYKKPINEEIITNILSMIKSVLFSSNLFNRDKISAIRLLMLLKKNDYPTEKINLKMFYFELKEQKDKISNTVSLAFSNDFNSISLDLSWIILKILFNDSENYEFFKNITLASNEEETYYITLLMIETLLFNNHAINEISEIENIINIVFKFSNNKYSETKVKVVNNLFNLIHSKYKDLAIILISEMYERDHFQVKIRILNQLEIIKLLYPETYDTIVKSAQKDNHYIIRKRAHELQNG